MLCQGRRPADAVQALGVEISTVRTQVGEMHEKTGTHSPAQLALPPHRRGALQCAAWPPPRPP
jgi:DNA-binding CsgD family transcriptional regulator